MFSSKVSACTDDIANWKRIRLFDCCAESRQDRVNYECQHRSLSGDLMIGLTSENPASSVRDPGIFIDSDLVIRIHVRMPDNVTFCSSACENCAVFDI
jgi:hypothetical protein